MSAIMRRSVSDARYPLRKVTCTAIAAGMSIRVQKRKYTRVHVACDNCRQRKTRCDSVRPSCGNCMKEGENCVYAASPPRPNDSNLVFMNERFDRIENILQKIIDTRAQDNESITEELRNILESSRKKEAQKPNDKISVSRKDKAIISNFNERLSHVKMHTSGNQESSTVYISGVFLSILSSTDIEVLSRLLDDPKLGQSLEERSYEVWRSSQSLLTVLFDNSTPISEDHIYYERCLEIFLQTTSPYIRCLIGTEDLDPRRSFSSDHLRKGITAAVVIIGSVGMRLDPNHGQLPLQKINLYEKSGYYQAIRVLNLIRFSKPGFLEVRLSMLLIWLLYTFSSFPSTLQLFDPIIGMAKAIGIDHCDNSSERNAQESVVWFLITNFQYLLAISMSIRAIEDQPEPNDDMMHDFFSNSEMTALQYSGGIHKIYDEAYDCLFHAMRHNNSAEYIYRDIKSLDEKLVSWRNQIPGAIWNIEVPPDSGLSSFLRTFPSGNLKYKYYHTVIAVHSIAAFSSEQFASYRGHSLAKVSNAARALFNASITSQLAKADCTLLHNCGITSAIICLLYKQLYYPYAKSNYEDLCLVKENITLFSLNGLVPNHRNPVSTIWETLADLMSRHYRIHHLNVENYTDNKGYSDLPIGKEFAESDQCSII